MREIVTLQLGNLSNYVATHFWNAQESYFTYTDEEQSFVDANVHWRAGVAADGSDTFLPRTVVYDLKGGFGSLRKINALYDAADETTSGSLWSRPPTVQKQQPIGQSAFQQSLDAGTEPAKLTTSSVRYWSDFSRVFYHPRSLVQLYDFELNSTIMPFERFSMGTELFHSLDKEHDIVDRDWRPFVEECDRMQGIQVFTTIDDAWGGFASSYLEALRDEYPKSTIWTWGLQAPVLNAPRERRQLRLTNIAHSLSQMYAQASMVVPLSLPEGKLPAGVSLDATSPWHVAALFSTAAETASLPSRLIAGRDRTRSSLDDMVQALNAGGNQTLANLQMSVGPRPAQSQDENQQLDMDFSRLGRTEQPRGSKRTPRTFGQLSSLRGSGHADDRSERTDDRLDQRQIVGQPVLRRYLTPLEFPLLDSYPSIYTSAPDESGADVETMIRTDASVTNRMKALRTQVTWAVGVDERESLANGLSEIADAYQDDWSSGSDDDDDDA